MGASYKRFFFVDNMYKMRKLNTSIDIIPLQGVSNEDMTSTMEKRQIDEQQMRVQRDPLIISRVQMVN